MEFQSGGGELHLQQARPQFGVRKRAIAPLLALCKAGGQNILTDEDSGVQTIVDRNITLYFDKPRTAKLLWVKKCEGAPKN